MDVYTTAFTYPRRSRQLHSPTSSFPSADLSNGSHAIAYPDAKDHESVQTLAMIAMSLHGCNVQSVYTEQGNGWTFHINGAYPEVMVTRAFILKECPVSGAISIKVARSEILDSPNTAPALKPEVQRKLDEIAAATYTHIAVVNSSNFLSNRTPPAGIDNSAGWSGLETERVCEIVVRGELDGVLLSRVRLLVMLDELSGLHAESLEIDQKLLPIVAGKKRVVLQNVQEETATNIYLPSPLQGLVGPDPAPATEAVKTSGTVWITGEFFNVQRARDMLYQLSSSKAKSIISRDTAILPRKLDWMVTDRSDDLKTIMSDNATFIQFPPIGSSTSLITVYGDHRVNVLRTIRCIMQLACQFYVAFFWLLPSVQFNVLLPPAPVNSVQVAAIIQQISAASGAEVVFKNMCFEMHGLENEVRAAVAMVMELDLVKAYRHEIRFQIELANEHREFISGKKNGKVNKIMQTTNVKIKFETFNDHNFLIDIAGPDSSVLQGLALLQEELPAEISFHVPESYHKRIIGVGGRSIQRIMKKYGVYVKFSNAEEFAALGGYNDNDDNVVARTPAKNAGNLEHLKQSVMELVNPKDKDFVNETVSIPRRYHRTLLGEKKVFIHDIEAKTNSRVHFPDKESASDVVIIYGPESQVQIATTMLLDHVPFEADMAVPPSADLALLCRSADFNALVDRVKRDLQVSVTPNIKTSRTANGASSMTPTDNSFKFRCQRSNSDFLVTAREMLETFLVNHNIPVYPSSTSANHKRGDSFADAFPHFESKLLATPNRLRNHHAESADLGRPSDPTERRLRLAASSPDVKAQYHASRYSGGAQQHYSTPSFVYSLDGMDDTSINNYRASTLSTNSMEYWMRLPGIAPDVANRTRHADDSAKRGSDSLLEAKIKEHLKETPQSSLQNRAQSLDLTFSLSRITESSSTLIPPSPTTSTANGELSPSAPSFPNLYGPPMSQAPIGSERANFDDEDVDDVARVISTLGL